MKSRTYRGGAGTIVGPTDPHERRHLSPFLDDDDGSGEGGGGGAVTLTDAQFREHQEAAATVKKIAGQVEKFDGRLSKTKEAVDAAMKTVNTLTERVVEQMQALPPARDVHVPLSISPAVTLTDALAPRRLTAGGSPTDSRKYAHTVAANPIRAAKLEGRTLTQFEQDAQQTFALLKAGHEWLMATDQAYARGEATIHDRMPVAAAQMDRLVKLTSVHWDGTATDGAEWIPILFTSNWIDVKTLPARVQIQFTGMNRVNIPRGTGGFSHPVDSDGATVTLLSSTGAPARARSTDPLPLATGPGTANLTHQVALQRGGVTLNEEFAEDAVGDVVSHANMVIERDMALAWDSALINGQDTVDSAELDGSNGLAANNGAYNGLRWHGHNGGGTTHAQDNGGTKLSVSQVTAERDKMGVFGVDPMENIVLVDPVNYLSLVHDDAVMTADVFGSAFTLRTGMLASIDGMALIPSDRMPANLDTDGDLASGTGTTTCAVVVNTTRGWVGVKNSIELRFVPSPGNYQLGVYGFARHSFAAKENTAEEWMRYIFNVATS